LRLEVAGRNRRGLEPARASSLKPQAFEIRGNGQPAAVQWCSLDADGLRRRFLRRLENRLRIVQDRSISELQTEPGEIDKLARRMGYNEPQGGGGRRLLDDYLIHRGRVRDLYRTFFPVSDG
jgi:hypothetical protein